MKLIVQRVKLYYYIICSVPPRFWISSRTMYFFIELETKSTRLGFDDSILVSIIASMTLGGLNEEGVEQWANADNKRYADIYFLRPWYGSQSFPGETLPFPRSLKVGQETALLYEVNYRSFLSSVFSVFCPVFPCRGNGAKSYTFTDGRADRLPIHSEMNRRRSKGVIFISDRWFPLDRWVDRT